MLAAARPPEKQSARFTLMNLMNQAKDEPLLLPWSAESAAAQLGQVMRALHARRSRA